MAGAFGTADEATLRAAAAAEPGTDGIDLVAEVTCSRRTRVAPTAGAGRRRIVAFDFGIKRTMLRHLAGLGTVEVVPASTTAAEVLARQPDGVFLSNGPGDPAMVGYAVDTIAELLGEVPIFGICLGHQLLSRALGGETFKLPFGHHGGNHPGAPRADRAHRDHQPEPQLLRRPDEPRRQGRGDSPQPQRRTNEGMRVLAAPAFSVQYHPEAGPGPHDRRYLFDDVRRADGWRRQVSTSPEVGRMPSAPTSTRS